jgi:hypothetical protein
MNLIPTSRHALQIRLVDLSGNIAVSPDGVAFLDAQITEPKDQCLGGIDEEFARESVRRERLEAAPRRDSNFKLGQSIGLLFEEEES